MTRFLCTGDWHVGAGLDYGREPGDRLRDQSAVVERIIDLAVDHDVDVLLLAGDLWQRRRPTPAELLTVWEPLKRLTAETEIEILAIPGNHCVEAAGSPIALDLFADIIDVRTRPGIWEGPGTSVAVLPWTPVSRLVAARGGGDRDRVNTEAAALLVATARGLRDQIPSGQPAVLLTHFSISGAATPTGVATDDFHEVVLDLDELAGLGFDAVVAGHIHLPDVINGPFDGGRPIFYVGSPAPIDFGEQSSPHGCWLLEIGEGETRRTFLPIQSRPFVTLDYDLGDDKGVEVAAFTDVVDAVVRVRYTATEEQARRVNHGWLREALLEAGAHKVHSIQPTILRENRARVEGVDEDLDPLQALDLWALAEQVEGESHGTLRMLTASYLEAVTA